jgi:hypothetical protein
MEELLKSAAIAWNPVLETRKRLREGNLTFLAVLAPFVAVVIACNLAVLSAQKFFIDSVSFVTGAKSPTEHPVFSTFSGAVLSAFTPLVLAGVVALLPTRTFAPVGRSATVAAVIVIAAAWAFYGAAIGISYNVLSGLMVAVHPGLGATLYFWLGLASAPLIIGLVSWFWFRVMSGVLNLTRANFALITICVLGCLLVVAALAISFVTSLVEGM